MQLVKETPLAVAWRTWLARPPRPSLTVVVKATFTLAEGELVLAPKQPPPEGERYVDDDVERALARDSDLTPFKRRAECFVLGSCHPPGGPAAQSQIAFQVGSVKKNVAVFGDRTWKAAGPSAPEPFEAMPLSWERALGGPGFAPNPVGAGLAPVVRAGAQVSLLPNLEDPQRLIRAPGDRPRPACTTPIARTWPERMRLAGTYDAAWLSQRYPGLPADIDWEYFNAAPADQRIEGYWRGDEEIVLVNLVLGQPSLRCRLPGLRPRAFLTPAGAPDPLAQLWEVTPLRLDTITVDGDARTVCAVWRGVLDVGSEELAEMGSLCVLSEAPGETRSLEDCRAVFRRAEERAREEKAALAGAAPPSAPAAGAPLFKTMMGGDVKWAHLDQAMTMEASSSPTEVMAELARAMKARGLDVDPEGVLGRALASSVPAARELDERELRAIEERVLEEERERRRGRSLELRERVRRAIHEGESCAGWDLSGVDLSRLRLSGGDFRGARFTRASLAGTIFGDTVFDEATFEEAELSDSQFEATSFRDAHLHFCRIERAHFGDATLDGAVVTDCLMRGVRFSRTFARGAEIAASVLEGATFDDSVFDGVDFTGSTLDEALFARTRLVDARLLGTASARAMRARRCDIEKLRASGADLSGSTFAACTAGGARFGGSDCRDVDFSFSELDRAAFADADLRGAKLMGCRLRRARFDRARLAGASLIKSDLLEARFEAADLAGADLRGANLHGAELFRADLSKAALELATLSATRLAR